MKKKLRIFSQTTTFRMILTFLGMLGSLVSGVLALGRLFISITVFVLRMLGLIEAKSRVEFAKRQSRRSEMRLIGSILSNIDRFPAEGPLGPNEMAMLRKERALLAKELEILVDEELAYLTVRYGEVR